MPDTEKDPCGTCGLCCRSYLVPVCGLDVWKICVSQRLPPEQFVFAAEQDTPRADGFYLDPASAPFGLALEKRGRLRAKGPCVFLLELRGGHSRCGIYEHRPVVCGAYPMLDVGGAVEPRSDALCPPDAWSPAALRRPSWSTAMQRRRMHFDIYHLVVARWNAHLPPAGTRDPHRLGDYLAYLLNVYDRLARLADGLGEDRVGAIERFWGTDPGSESGAGAGWLNYAAEVREIVNAFYPAVPPL
jgi:Fe-S-cluster containining protein